MSFYYVLMDIKNTCHQAWIQKISQGAQKKKKSYNYLSFISAKYTFQIVYLVDCKKKK
jgi:hypothetical protein